MSNLEMLTTVVANDGAILFFALGFAEFIGFPVASVPALLAGGTVARMTPTADPLGMVLAAAAGGLTADGVLYGLTRWKGPVMVDAACGLTSNPKSCVLFITDRVERIGPQFILGAKFVPGAGNLVAPAATLAGVGLRRFLSRDLVALMAWAGIYTGAGWILSSQIEPVLTWAGSYLRWLVPAAAVLIGLAALWRILRVHTRLHERTGSGP